MYIYIYTFTTTIAIPFEHILRIILTTVLLASSAGAMAFGDAGEAQGLK